jgi:predicted permease
MPDWRRFVKERLSLPELEGGGEERIREELVDYLEQVYEQEIAHGKSATEAEARAIEKLGDLEPVVQNIVGSGRFRVRSAIATRQDELVASLHGRGEIWSWLADALTDFRHAIRAIRRSPGFHLIVVLTFALGIGGSTAIFSVLNTVLFEPLPFPEASRLVTIWTPQVGSEGVPLSAPDYHDYRRASSAFSAWGAYSEGWFNLTDGGRPERLEGVQCTAGLMLALGVAPAHGRLFSEAEEDDPGSRLVLLGDGLWKRRFGSDPSMVGKTIILNSEPFTVVGIMPPEFRFPGWLSLRKADVYTLLSVPNDPATRGSQYLFAIGRLGEGQTLDTADQELNTIASRLAEEYPNDNHRRVASVIPLREIVIGDSARPLLFLMGAVIFVLLIACSNVSGLLLAKTAARQGELAIRGALGAGRGRLTRQLLVEGCALSLVGGTSGLLLAWWGIGGLRGLVPDALPRASDIHLDGTVLLFTLGLSVIVGIVVGLLPVLSTSRIDLNRAIRECERSLDSGGGRNRFLKALVVAQFALALVLVNGEALMLKSLWNATGRCELREPDDVLIAGLSLDGPAYSALPPDASIIEEPAARSHFMDELFERVSALPGVKSVGASTRLPYSYGWTGGVLVEGEEFDPETQRPMTWFVCAGGDYFDAMGIQLVRGRSLRAGDDAEGAVNVVVNRTFAEHFWPGENPLGKRVKGNSEPSWFEATVVGVVDDVRQSGLEGAVSQEMYLPFFPSFMPDRWLVIRTGGDPAALTPAVRREIAALDSGLPLSSVFTGVEMYENSAGGRRFNTVLLGLFAAVAVLLIAAGEYGVLAYDVVRRRHEIGVRTALGADRRRIVLLVFSRGLKLALIGIAIGLAGAAATSRLLESLLFQVAPLHPASLALAAAFLVLIGILASVLPALRAASIDPVRALQSE